MKRILRLVSVSLFVVTFAALPAFGQEIPKEQWTDTPSFDGTNANVSVFWHDTFLHHLRAEFAGVEVTNLYLFVESSTAPNGEGWTYQYPTEGAPETWIPLKNVEAWKKFAAHVKSQFASIGDGLYVETEPYMLLAKVLNVRTFEFHGGVFIFQGTNGWKSISADDWRGKLPNIGEKIHLGRQTGGDENFFAVSKIGNEFLISPALVKELSEKPSGGGADYMVKQPDGSFLLPRIVVEAPPKEYKEE